MIIVQLGKSVAIWAQVEPMFALTPAFLGTLGEGQGVCSQSFVASDRVKVFTLEGVQIGLPGVGEGVNRLTFPAGYVIKQALDAPIWIRFATIDEIAQTPAGCQAQWWRELDMKPKAFCYCNGTPAFENQPIGLRGDTITALAQAAEQPLVQAKPCLDVSGIATPPTPRSDSESE